MPVRETDNGSPAWLAELNEWLMQLRECAERFGLTEYVHEAEQLRAQLKQQALSIVVVGEFNNGKSTLINALIGENLLPIDVMPTTSLIHTITSDDMRSADIRYGNGQLQSIEPTAETLKHLLSNEMGDTYSPKEISGIELRLPIRSLVQGTVIVDTPGLNDLNELRSDVTYGYIPRADAVIVVLNALQPVRGTERVFLEDTLLKEGLDRIIFALNFADLTDGAEEVVVQAAQRRLQSIPAFADVMPLLVSALEGLEAQMMGNEALWESSGMAALEREIHRLTGSGSTAELRWKSSLRSAERLVHHMMDTVSVKCNTAAYDRERLLAELEELRRWQDGWKERQDTLDRYIDERRVEMQQMVRKSIRYLFDNLTEELLEMTEYYQGVDLVKFVTTDVPFTVKRRLKGWVEQYGNRIDDLLGKLAEQLSVGLSQSFDMDIQLRPIKIDLTDVRTDAHISAQSGFDPMVKSGLIVGGVGTAALLLGGPIIVPIITLSGLPFVQKMVRDRDHRKQKPKLKGIIQEQLDQVEQRFFEGIFGYVNDYVNRIHRMAVEEYDKRSDMYTKETKMRLNELEQETQAGEMKSSNWRNASLEAERMCETLRQLATERGMEHE